MKKIFIGIVLVVTLTPLCFAYGSAKSKAIDVSLMDLICNPENYHGKLVRVIGVARIEFEGNGIWFTEEHYKYGIYKNSLWIELNYETLGASRKDLMEYNGKYVLMEGVFDKNKKGHMGMNSGTLKNVTRYMLWERGEK